MQGLATKMLRSISLKRHLRTFSRDDFSHLGSRDAIAQALSRLTRQGVIRRISPGLYDVPRVNPRLGRLSPDMDTVARAIARKNKITLQPAGALAANLLGLSTQVPAVRVYFTDGFSKQFRIGGQKVVFRHGSPRNMAGAGRISGVVFQALRYLGRKTITNDRLAKLNQMLSARDKRVTAADAKHTFAWIRPLVRKITADSN